MKLDPQKLVAPPRPRYFDGRALTAADLHAEQNYRREKAWLHNRMLHGYGIVSGLDVTVQENENDAVQVVIAPGYALDGYGRELIVPESLSVAVGQARRDFVVYLEFAERADAASVVPLADGAPQATRISETVRVLFEPPTERLTPPPARADFAIPLARVRKPHQQWQHDRTFRPPRAK